jgi:endonuclease-3 related protein
MGKAGGGKTKSQSAVMLYYQAMRQHFGDPHWWPARTTVEVVIGAVLTQNTNWRNVEKAIANLATHHCLDAEKILALPTAKLEQLIRPSGYFRIKAQRLRRVMEWYASHNKAGLESFDTIPTGELRAQLLAINGVGPETADSILLYALQRPVFVIDAYTRRLAQRHKLMPDKDCQDYHALQDYFQRQVPAQAEVYNQYHALIVQTGKHFCGPEAKCDQCPLRGFLPSQRHKR